MHAQHITLSGSSVEIQDVIIPELTLVDDTPLPTCDPYNSVEDHGVVVEDLRSEFAANNALRTS